MEKLTTTFRRHPLYFTGILIFCALALLVHLIFPSGTLVISLDSTHPVWLNVLMVNYTFMGDGFFAIGLVLFVAIYLQRKKLATQLAIAVCLTQFFVLGIKYLLTGRVETEAGQYLFFESEEQLVSGGQIISGHTALFFAMITLVLQEWKNKNGSILFLSLGFVMGFSRMYLAQHSLGEIGFGMLLGTAMGFAAPYLLNIRWGHGFKTSKWSYHPVHGVDPQPGLQTG